MDPHQRMLEEYGLLVDQACLQLQPNHQHQTKLGDFDKHHLLYKSHVSTLQVGLADLHNRDTSSHLSLGQEES